MRRLAVATLGAGLISAGGRLAAAQDLTMEEIGKRFESMTPKPVEFRFVAPAGWSENLAAQRPVVAVSPDAARTGAEALVDGDGYSVWVAPLGAAAPFAVIDLGTSLPFDRLVIFGRYTDARGTQGGNNAVRKLSFAVADSEAGPWRDLGEFAVHGPKAVCFKRAGGQMCMFVDRAEPTIAATKAIGRYLRVTLAEAYWVQAARPEWKTSVAISELMVFNSTSAEPRGGQARR
jgi:hypothetical protein